MDHDTVTIPESNGDAEYTFCDNESGDSGKGEFYGSIESHCADLEQSIDLHHNQVIVGGASSAWTHTWSGNQIEVLGSGEDDVQIKSIVEVDGKLETALGSSASLNLSFELYDITNDARSEYTILSHNVGGVGYEVYNNETMHTTAYPTLEAGNEYRLETHLHIEANAVSVGSTVASFGHCGAMWPATVDHHVDSMCFEIRF